MRYLSYCWIWDTS